MKNEELKPFDLCMINGCNKKGKLIGKLGGIKLKYCQQHFEYGNRVLNFFINARTGYKLNKFLKETKDDWFINNQPKLSTESELAIKEYLVKGISRIEDINKLSRHASTNLNLYENEPDLDEDNI